MATLDEVTKKLIENNAENKLGHEMTRIELGKVNKNFDKYFQFLKSGDKLEDRLEKKAAPIRGGAGKGGGGGSGGGEGVTLAALTGIGGIAAAISALGASLAGLDDAFKALRVVQIADNIAEALKSFTRGTATFIDTVTDFVKGVGNFGKNLKNSIVIPDETKALLKGLPDLLKTRVATLFAESELLKPIRTAIDNFKIGFDRVGTKATGVVDDILKVEDFSTISAKLGAMIGSVKNVFTGADDTGGIFGFFTKISDTFSEIVKFFPRIDFTSLGKAFGSFEGGTGLLGFLGKIFDFIDPLLTPIKKILGLALKPAFQLFLSVFDFLYGFYEGFKNAEGSLIDRLGAGIEGGIKGVIKGFTDAIDLILIELPAWLLGKLGFEGVASKLKEFSLTALVDPAWEATKKFFVDAFTNPTESMQSLGSSIGNLSEQFIKAILRAALPSPAADYAFYDPRRYAQLAIPPEVYKYAGINPETGQRITASQNIAEQQAQFDQMRMGRGGAASGPITFNTGGDTSVTSPQAFAMPPTSPFDVGDEMIADMALTRRGYR